MIVETPNPAWTVYAHIAPNGKMYVGITHDDPVHRWNHGNGYKSNRHFTGAIKQFGWDNFQHEIVASNLTGEEAGRMEQLLIRELNLNNPKYGYNKT